MVHETHGTRQPLVFFQHVKEGRHGSFAQTNQRQNASIAYQIHPVGYFGLSDIDLIQGENEISDLLLCTPFVEYRQASASAGTLPNIPFFCRLLSSLDDLFGLRKKPLIDFALVEPQQTLAI